MEAESHSGIARLVQQSLGTSALFPSYVFVTMKYIFIQYIYKYLGGFHKSHGDREYTSPHSLIPQCKQYLWNNMDAQKAAPHLLVDAMKRKPNEDVQITKLQ
jgi:hypothetical protein